MYALSIFHSKQILHCWLIRILYWFFLLPDRASSLLAGGTLRSWIDILRFSILSFLKAIDCIFVGNFLENCRLNIFYVSLHLKFSIIWTECITHNVICQDECFNFSVFYKLGLFDKKNLLTAVSFIRCETFFNTFLAETKRF